MGMDFNLIKTEIDSIGATISILDAEETLSRWKKIAELYGMQKKYMFQFWDELDSPSILCTDNGWEIIANFIIPLSNVYLFFELADEKNAFSFRYGNELSTVLIESGCRDFYLLDENMSFLICYNDSNIILAEGIAKIWLAGIAMQAEN